GLADFADVWIPEAVMDKQSFFAAFDERRLAEYLEVLRRVGQRQLDLGRERVDGAFSLSEQLQQFETMRAGERLADTGELAVEAIFEITMGVGSHKSSNK